MKKLILFAYFFALLSTSLLQAECVDCPYENDPDYCSRCCAQGRYVDSECAKRCNNCILYSDEGTQEARDYPF